MATCYKCSTTLPEMEKGPQLSRSATCSSCGAFVRCCKNCPQFRPPNDCAEPQADWVKDRTAGNFCEWFMLNDKQGQGEVSPDKEAPQEDAFASLFKKD